MFSNKECQKFATVYQLIVHLNVFEKLPLNHQVTTKGRHQMMKNHHFD